MARGGKRRREEEEEVKDYIAEKEEMVVKRMLWDLWDLWDFFVRLVKA